MDTLSYWLARLEPLIRAEQEGEIIVVLANRCGTEGEAVYAGTSAVLGIQAGEVKVYGILGRGEKELLVVDTSEGPRAKLVSQPNSTVLASTRDSKSSKSSDNSDTSKSSNDSQVSETSRKSDASSKSAESNLTVDTSASKRFNSPSPLTPDAMEFSMDDEIMSPVSPVDAKSPSTFFSKGERVKATPYIESLKSSIEEPCDFQAPQPDSPTLNRPQSPKSRNASRTRQAEWQQPALVNHDLVHQTEVLRANSVISPPHSASSLQDEVQTSTTCPGLGPRCIHTPPRPKSTVW